MPPRQTSRAAQAPPSRERSSSPVRLFVRRGAVKRFEALKEKTAQLDVVVAWDRREGERRATPAAVEGDRRRSDRRQQTPFTWDLADFAIVVDRAPVK